MNFYNGLQFIYYQHVDGSLSYTPYKWVIAIKLLLNCTRPRPEEPYGYKEELKVVSISIIIDKITNK